MIQFSPPLRPAVLFKRYKRFLADVQFENGAQHTIYCANTGAMTGCALPHSKIWYSESSNHKRKYRFSWELSSNPQGDIICVNTLRANQLIFEALKHGLIQQLRGYTKLQAEVKLNEKSRIDFVLSQYNSSQHEMQPDAYVEVKSVTLLSNEQQGYFPDAKTLRGQKHLIELMSLKEQGYRAILMFAVLHTGINSVAVASHIDPTYNKLFKQAVAQGVEVYAYQAHITCSQITINKQVPVLFDYL